MFRRGLTWLRGARPRPARLLALVALLLVIGLGLTLAGVHAWAWYHLRAAERALGRYRLPEARGHLARCLRAWPRHFRAHLLAAQTARRLDDFEAAERHLARCQEIRGGLPDAVVLEQTLLRAQRGGMDPMTPYLRSLVEDDHPATPLILEAMARGYLRAFRYLDAAAVLAVWLGRDPDDVQANFMLGWVREQIGPQQQAVDNYRRVVEVDPEHEEGRLRLAIVLMERALPAEARPHLEYLARKRPDDPEVLVRLARCRMALGEEDEAQEVLDRVLAEHPRHHLALLARGELALEQDRPAQAEGLFRRAIALDPADFPGHYNLTKALRQQGKEAEAKQVDARLKVLEADSARLGKIVKDELGKKPNDPALQTEIGRILLRAGSEREGLQWLYTALKNDPAYRPAHRALLAHFDRAGDGRRAEVHRRFLRPRAAPHSPGR